MEIRKPIGAKLFTNNLPSKSMVDVEVIEDTDGLPSLRFWSHGRTMLAIDIAISDLIYITEWAQTS